MKNIILTFTLTNLVWTSVLLYEFVSGKVERPTQDYVEELSRK